MKRVWYIDSTLRDGEQAPGVSFTMEEKMKIAFMLNELGIDEVEAGTPAIGKFEIDTIRTIAQAGFSFKTTSWCRARIEDIEAARSTFTNGINVSFPVSDIQLKAMGKDLSWIIREMQRLLPITSNSFEYVAVGLQDASRVDYNVLKEVIGYALIMGAFRIRIADTVGILNPIKTSFLFNRLTSDFPECNFEFHGHNDLGMATANSVTAVLSGANSISTTINGIGERAGNASLDEVVMGLFYSEGIENKFKLEILQKIANYVAISSNREIPESKPITGSKVYSHESGIHTNLLLRDRSTYQIIDSELIGREIGTEIVFGKHSGTGALHDLFHNQGIEISLKHLHSILSQLKIRAGIKKENLRLDEIMELYYQLT